MIAKIKSGLKSKDGKRLLSNFLSLSILQGVNVILPLLTLPYLAKVLGAEYFGLLAFATAFVMYFQIITDYGFNLTATREISIFREDKDKVTEIFSSVMVVKIVLLLLSFGLMSLLVFSFDMFSKDWKIYFLTFGIVIGQVLFPVWFFQGMEKMKYITYLNILSKSIFTVAIFVFVNTQSDYYLVPIFTSIGFIIAGIWSLFFIRNEFNVKFKFQPLTAYKERLVEGWPVFLSGMFSSFYTISTTFILGLFASKEIVGHYALAEKIVKAFGNLFGPLNSAIFPYISKLVKTSRKRAKLFLRNIVVYSSIAMILSSVLLFAFSEFIIMTISNESFRNSIVVLKIMSVFPLIITLARIFSVNYLINFDLKKYLMKIYFYSAVLSFALAFVLVPMYFEIGSAITVVIVEAFATIYMSSVINKQIGFKGE